MSLGQHGRSGTKDQVRAKNFRRFPDEGKQSGVAAECVHEPCHVRYRKGPDQIPAEWIRLQRPRAQRGVEPVRQVHAGPDIKSAGLKPSPLPLSPQRSRVIRVT
jgi:hypothetical protein